MSLAEQTLVLAQGSGLKQRQQAGWLVRNWQGAGACADRQDL